MLRALLVSSILTLHGPIVVSHPSLSNSMRPIAVSHPSLSNSMIHVSHIQEERVLVVHHCEEPLWNVNGLSYQGGLGWLHATWLTFRLPWMPLNMAYASITEQSIAMIRFANRYGWPDLSGCHAY